MNMVIAIVFMIDTRVQKNLYLVLVDSNNPFLGNLRSLFSKKTIYMRAEDFSVKDLTIINKKYLNEVQ